MLQSHEEDPFPVFGNIFPRIYQKYPKSPYPADARFLREIATKENQIISCGGGVVLKEKNVDIMKSCGTIVLLTAEPETIYHRVKGDSSRPLLNGNMSAAYICELMEERQECYEDAADIVVATDHRDISAIVEKICRKLR